MRLDTCSRPVFARHESFHPRHGWLKKAVDGAARDPSVFTREDAIVELGVGKNMVRAIRHWGLATKVLAELPDPRRPRTSLATPSRIGDVLLGHAGWDPYCEAPATLWLLHWLLVAPPTISPVWWLALNEFPAVEFTQEELVDYAVAFVAGVADWKTPHPSSVKKDVDCFLRMYAMAAPGDDDGDDLIDCPFRELSVLRPVAGGRRSYRYAIGPKPSLPPEVAMFAALDFVARTEAASHTVTLSRLATEPGGPGRAFKITEKDLAALLTKAAGHGVSVVDAAGVGQLSFGEDPAKAATEVIWRHYVALGSVATRPVAAVAGRDADRPTGEVAESPAPARARPREVDPYGPAPADPLARLDWTQARMEIGLGSKGPSR